MLDTASQRKFSQGCAEASLGYAAASTAAYTQIATNVIDFWMQALTGFVSGVEGKPVSANTKPSPGLEREVPFGMSFADWTPFAMFDPRRIAGMMTFDSAPAPVAAYMAVANTVPLRGTPASWPFAHAMIDSGVPRSVAWPAAEANAAVLGAADVASKGMRKVLVNSQSASGFATAMPHVLPSAAFVLLAGLYNMHPLVSAGNWTRLFG